MKRALVILFLSAIAGTVCASEADVLRGGRTEIPERLDLQTARLLALEHNPVLKQTRQRMRQQDGIIREAQAARRPQLDVRSGYTLVDQSREQSFGSATAPDDTRWDADAEASVAVYAGGRNRLSVRSEKERKRAVEANLEAATQELLAEVHETYYDAQLARETIEVQQRAIGVLEEQLKYAHNRVAAGVGPAFDVMQAEVAAANAQPPLIRARNDYRRNIDNLRRILGLVFPPGKDAQDIRLEDMVEPEYTDLDLETALLIASEQRPELREMASQVQAARDDVTVERRDNTPVVDLFVNYGAESDQFGDEDMLDGWAAGVRMNWPMWDGGESKGRVQQSIAQLLQLVYEEEEVRLRIASEVRQAFYDYEEAGSILETTGLVTEQAEEALRLARNRYQAGRGTQLDVLESQLQLTRARLERSTAVNNLQRALVRIKRAMGAPL